MQQGVANDLSRGSHPSPGPIPFTQIKCCRTIQNHKNALRLLFSQRTQINPCLQGNSNQIGLVFTWLPSLISLVSPFLAFRQNRHRAPKVSLKDQRNPQESESHMCCHAGSHMCTWILRQREAWSEQIRDLAAAEIEGRKEAKEG